jgi:YD repeat-containing protein
MKNSMVISRANLLILALSITALSPSLYAEPEYRYDEQQRLILVIADDGTVTSYSYDKDGNRVRNDDGTSNRIEFDDTGKSAN